MRIVKLRECKICLNNTLNPTISIGRNDLCRLCELYKNNFDGKLLEKELKFLKTFIGDSKNKKYDVMVGISGGKDSTAILYTVLKMGFTPLAFTFDLGYYPQHIFSRAAQVARKLGIDYVRIDIKKYIQKHDLVSYQKTAELYSKKITPSLKREFLRNYVQGKKYYSIKSKKSHAFVRVCILCRHTVVPSYYREAARRGIKLIVLGINEWTGLSQDKKSNRFIFSGIRKIKLFSDKPPLYIVHLPFLLQRRISDVNEILKTLGWKKPRGERLIETNANSCLLARASESKADKLLGFHPDSTRLSREVTVGFITKQQARKALAKVHNYRYSVRQVLQRAEIIK